ncbi:hypothetical protein NHX12_021335 [Muraenolepis orangiensis]|uniref:C2H2-type domain-containing protein n=1 Tax=Muraenolepis orangiensis TaxID=630683 RepID=A0A9Q0IUC8_9TELE|nr:hypothetical protein NHX12_021335 [Muraenolepis orangiensis]
MEVLFFIKDSSGYRLGDSGMADEGESSPACVENGNSDHFGMDQVPMIRLGDTQWCPEVRGVDMDWLELAYVLPSHFMGEEMTVGDYLKELEEDDGVYLVYSDRLETDGDAYAFQLQLPPKEVESKPPPPPTGREHLRRSLAKKSGKYGAPSGHSLRGTVSLTSEDGASRQETTTKALVCSLCPPPGKLFKNMAGFSVHLKQLHFGGLRKSLLCDMCQKHCRNQLALDDHIRRHASKAAVFQCPLCSFKAPGNIRKRGVKGRFSIRVHLETEHPGVVPECKVCKKSFLNLDSYLKDQVRHIGVTPFYCPKCQIYEMTERGLQAHIRNHKHKKGEREREEKSQGGKEATRRLLADML